MRGLRKHFAELWLSYAGVLVSSRGYQRMAQPFRQVAAEIELYFRVCLTISQIHAITLPHLRNDAVIWIWQKASTECGTLL
jgi:hypothetical protein